MIIVAGFPGVGKTHYYNQVISFNPSIKIHDSDSSKFSWILNSGKKQRNPDFPNNYINHIKSLQGLVLVSTHPEVRSSLEENNLHYYLVYPSRLLKEEYLQRYRTRGSPPSFISLMDEQWDSFIDSVQSTEGCTHVTLTPGMYLKDVVGMMLIEALYE